MSTDNLVFNSEEQKKHEEFLQNYLNERNIITNQSLSQSKERIKNWTEADWQKSGQAFNQICWELSQLLEKKQRADSREVQSVIYKHYLWINKFWTPNRESYAGHADFIQNSALKEVYEKYSVGLSSFISQAIKIFAEKDLD